MGSDLIFKKIIGVEVDLIYRAFTSAAALREWLCDVSITNPSEGGWIYLAWNKGYYANGNFTKLIPDKAVSFTWIGKDEPARSHVVVTIEKTSSEKESEVILRHTGLDENNILEESRQEIAEGWEKGLENLKMTLEEGVDLRITNRPLIGIFPMDLPKLSISDSSKLELPVDYGVVVSNVVPDFGADRAGIQAGDVIVAIGGEKVERITIMASIIDNYSPGEKLEIDVYRGQEKRSFVIDTTPQMALVPPESPEELAKEIEKDNSKLLLLLEKTLVGVTEGEASFSPGSDKLSVKETIAHLILHERDLQAWINDLVFDLEPCCYRLPDHCLIRLRALIMTYPSLDEIIAEFRRSLQETVATVAFLDEQFTRRKSSYWRIGYNLLEKIVPYQEYIQNLEEIVQEAQQNI